MAAARRVYKTAREKPENPLNGLPRIVDVPEKWRKSQGGRFVLVPTPLMADEEIRTVRKGKSPAASKTSRKPSYRQAMETCGEENERRATPR